ncbi:MAG: DUF1566 domain-containing protein [Deltaproteobacteria bacterium]|nr:DUF1566 domain-containing protein [Deltaproteobacteria bacterium]
MRRLYLMALMSVLGLGLGLVLSWSSGESGDDGNGSNDDDALGDDDNAAGDTWTDSLSGLTWQVTPPSDHITWDTAKTYCDYLTLAGGGWHLPTIAEIRTLIRGCDGTVTGGSCGVTDSCLNDYCKNDTCWACISGEGPNNGCYGPTELPNECDPFWSSSPVADVGRAWRVEFDLGRIASDYGGSYGNNLARCVR